MSNPSDPATKADISHVNGRIDRLDSDITLLQLQTRSSKEKLDDLGTDVRNLETRVGGLEGKIGSLEGKVEGLDKKVENLDKKVDDIKYDVRRLEVLHEEMDGKLDAILEAVGPKMVDITAHGATLDDHEDRITTLEVLKKAAA